MKKFLALCLTAFLTLCCLTACDSFDGLFGRAEGVSCKKYENCAVFTFDDFEERTKASFELERTGLGEGAIYYQVNLEEGALSINYKDTGLIHQNQPLGEFTAEDEMPFNGSGGYIEGDKITITFESFNSVSGEIIIAFTEDALKAVHGNLHHHEHTGQWVVFNKSTHYYQYTCGCTLPDRIEEHVNYDTDMFCDICGYEFNGGTVEVFFLKDYASWLTELNAENVAEIKTTFEYVGVAPGRLKDISRTTDKTVIADMLNKYVNTEMRSVTREETYISGGSAFTIEFILADGTVKELYFNNGFYTYGLAEEEISALLCFELDSIPTLEGYDNVTESNGFITYIGTGAVYDGENNHVCEIPIDELEFVVFDGDLPAVVTGYFYYIDTEFGTLWFTYNSEIFFVRFDGEDNYTASYQLVDKNLDELIAEYTENSENGKEYSLTMNDKEWLYEDIGSSYKAGDTVTVKISLAIDMGYLFLVNGEEIATCRDVDGLYWEFTFTMPSADAVIDFKTYDGFLSDYNEAVLIEAYWKKHLDADYVSIRRYYGQLASGALVAMIDSGGYDAVMWEEIVGNVIFPYCDGNRIIVLYNNEFYTLEEAYAMGCITDEELTVISELHNDR